MELRLESYGYTPFFSASFESQKIHFGGEEAQPGLQPARVIFASRGHYRLVTGNGEVSAEPAGRLRLGTPPAVGDWLVVSVDGDRASILAVLPRSTCLSRKVAGDVTREQVVAANVDTVFLVMGLDGDYNLRRLERFSVLARQSGAEPVVVLTKSDLSADPVAARLDAQLAAPGIPVHGVCALRGEGLEPLRFHLATGKTVALLGSSGVGKSTLLNSLCGVERMRTGAVREGDDRGRHTTTHRELVKLPGGGLLIDNPGVREIQLWAEEEALSAAFDDVEELADRCRFRDCGHDGEPGCAVAEAVERGELEASRLESWRGLARELASLERRRNVALQRQEDRKNSRLYRRVQKAKKSRRAF